MSEPDEPIFRREAMEHHALRALRQDVLRVGPAWARWAFRTVLLVVAVAAGYASIVRIEDHASGPAVLLCEGRSELSLPDDGTVVSVVEPGRAVTKGEVLVRVVGADLSSPNDGVVGAVLVRPGERVAPGRPLVSVRPPGPCRMIAATLPAQHRARYQPGLRGVFVPAEGGARAIEVTIVSAGVEVVRDARTAELMQVSARVEQAGSLLDGTRGTLEVPVGSRRLWRLLVPGLRRASDE